jgi:hypothetical protein
LWISAYGIWWLSSDNGFLMKPPWIPLAGSVLFFQYSSPL